MTKQGYIMAIFSLLLVLSAVWGSTSGSLRLFSDDPDIIRNTSQLIRSRGFVPELHHPVTQDGYILSLFRLINPHRSPANSGASIPIYFQHGLFGNSDDFILSKHERLTPDGLLNIYDNWLTNCTGLDPDRVGQSLAYVLASCGYDVWLGNFRGNRYSTGHVLLDSRKGSEYWSFNLDHLSKYDVTANIHYILEQTGRAQLGYVGHSLGTSVMFQLLSSQPEYSAYIKPAIMLAPVAHVHKIRAPLLLLAAYNQPFIDWLAKVRAPIFGLSSSLMAILDQLIGTFICGNQFFQPLCTIFLFSICGFDYPNTNQVCMRPLTDVQFNLLDWINTIQSIIPFAYGHFPDNTATQVLAHLGQRVTQDTFSFFDFGTSGNRQHYRGNRLAPEYDLGRIDSQYLILISGINDWLADTDDVEILRQQLKVKPYKDYVVPYTLFNHADFLFGNNVGRLQNGLILQWLHELYAP